MIYFLWPKESSFDHKGFALDPTTYILYACFNTLIDKQNKKNKAKLTKQKQK